MERPLLPHPAGLDLPADRLFQRGLHHRPVRLGADPADPADAAGADRRLLRRLRPLGHGHELAGADAGQRRAPTSSAPSRAASPPSPCSWRWVSWAFCSCAAAAGWRPGGGRASRDPVVRRSPVARGGRGRSRGRSGALSHPRHAPGRRATSVRLFNGIDGEWSARVVEVGKRTCRLAVEALVRTQTPDARPRAARGARQTRPAGDDRREGDGAGRAADPPPANGAHERRPHQSRATCGDRARGRRAVRPARRSRDQGRRASRRPPRGVGGRPAARCSATRPAMRRAPWRRCCARAGPLGRADRSRGRLHARGAGGHTGASAAVPVSLGARVLRADTAAIAALAIWQSTFGEEVGLEVGAALAPSAGLRRGWLQTEQGWPRRSATTVL